MIVQLGSWGRSSRHFGFIGDSLSRQLVNALLCALTRQGLKGETNKGKLKISDLTVTFGADVFGAGGGEAKVSYFSNSFGSMDKVSRATTLPRATALPRPRV